MTTTTRPRMAVKNQASASEYGAEVLIYGFIGDWWTGMDADTFARQIETISANTILVRMHSLGGDVWDGIAIMNALKRHTAKVTVVVEGIAASMASAIAVGGSDELIMAPHSQLMIHDAWGGGFGNSEELQKYAADMDRESQNLAEIYATRAGTPVEEWREAMREETWFKAEEAVAVGLADSIGYAGLAAPSEPATIQDFEDHRIMATLRHRGRDDAPPPPSRLMPPQEDPTMKLADKITAKLRTANATATESQILAALDEALGLTPNAETPQAPAAADTAPKNVLELTDEETTEILALAGLEEGATAREILDALAEKLADTTNAQASALTTPVDKETLAELRQLAAEGIVARADNQNRARADLVEKAIRENRISAKSRDRWIKALANSPESAEKELLAIPVDTIPRAELGHNREDHTDTPSTESAAIIAAFHS
ncbi:hypothetical protein EAH68_12775 [Corynebacterium hylobatis]|uniref:ATP-dependent Clp protease proteolytic subunit n=1 Tax=Corynebacterium hylobatis TaxID=1859290 RepID=A0A3S0B333_9CORY|nr:head maturation protease, ClpP-related [Corynebacterium hylobatis]RSZ61531.1 hypothetical protein EAH68_12775 [Corynebacterium hylobatis]